MMKHKTKRVKVNGLEADIDEMLAPLIRLLWKAAVMTEQCCQEYWPGLACIEFPGTSEVMEFLDVAQRNYRVELETWDEGQDGAHAIGVRLLVIFPAADIPMLVKAWASKGKARS